MPTIGLEKKTQDNTEHTSVFVSLGDSIKQSGDTFQINDSLLITSTPESNTGSPTISGKLSKLYESDTA